MTAALSKVGLADQGLKDRALGTILGLAVGNLLGIPTEGWWYHEIDRRYPRGVLYLDRHEVDRVMDDDLAQAVDLAEALVSRNDTVAEFDRRLEVWAEENGRGMGSLTRSVIHRMENSTSLFEAARTEYERDPRSPNGGLMRCAPVALARHGSPELLVADSAATCAVTHYSSTCQWSCIILNTVIALLLRGEAPALSAVMAAASGDGCPDLLGQSQREGIPTEILSAILVGDTNPYDATWLRQNQVLVGHTLLALQVGLWAAGTPLDFETALRQVVEGGGDTDTHGAVAGALLGTRYGSSAIPQRWLKCIPQRGRIEELVQGLLDLDN